jgi:hypothetical protein
MRTTCHLTPVVLWVVGVLMLYNVADSFRGVLFFIPFALGPQAITHAAIIRAKSVRGQFVLLAALLVYFAWFTLVYVDAFYVHLDPQSSIALLFVGIYSLPVLGVFWWAAYLEESKFRANQSPE